MARKEIHIGRQTVRERAGTVKINDNFEELYDTTAASAAAIAINAADIAINTADIALNTTHRLSTSNPHGTDIENLGSGTLAELNDAIIDATLGDAGDYLPLAGGTLTGNLIISGADLGVTGTRVTKGWFTNIESTFMPTVGGTAIDTTWAADDAVVTAAFIAADAVVTSAYQAADALKVAKAGDTMTGDLGLTGTRVPKGWFTNIESTFMPTVGGTSIETTWQAYTDTALGSYLPLAGGTLTGPLLLTASNDIGATGTRVNKGWFTNLEVTNMPTVGNVSIQDTFVDVAGDTMTGDLGIGGDVVGDERLRVTGGGILADGTTGTVPASGAGTRFMWVPSQAALFAGIVDSTQADSLGAGSINLGTNNTAQGAGAVSIGIENTITAGNNSMCIGASNTATSAYSIGNGNTVTSVGSIGVGVSNTITALSNNTAAGYGNSITGSGLAACAVGFQNISTGFFSVALGYKCESTSTGGVAMGSQCLAAALNSSAIGFFVKTAASGSVVIGKGVSSGNELVNSTANTLALGANSTVPTMVLTDSGGAGLYGDVQLPGNNQLLQFGASQNAHITYDATDLVIDPDASGSGIVLIGATGDDDIQFNDAFVDGDVVINEATGHGIKVDTGSPTWGYRDILGQILVKTTGASDPVWRQIAGTIMYAFDFAPGNYVWISFHIPHDYVEGTDVSFHVHWMTDSTDTTNTVNWQVHWMYAKGHGGGAFPVASLSAVQFNSISGGQYNHEVSESIDQTISGLEPDGIIYTRIRRVSNGGTDVNDIFVLQADVHYQSTNMGTKSKAPNFYT